VAFIQNYGQQRAERNRLKRAKKEAKEQKHRDAVLRRKAGPDADAPMEFGATGTDSSRSANEAEETVLS